MEEFDCLQSYVGVPLAGELPLLIIVWRSRGLWVTILLQRVNIRSSIHQTRSPHCFRYGINGKILRFEVGMRSEIERVIEGMMVTIQMWITPGPFPPAAARQHAVIAEAIEVEPNLLNTFSLLKLKYSSVTCACINKASLHTLFIIRVKIFSCNKFSWVSLPTKFF